MPEDLGGAPEDMGDAPEDLDVFVRQVRVSFLGANLATLPMATGSRSLLPQILLVFRSPQNHALPA